MSRPLPSPADLDERDRRRMELQHSRVFKAWLARSTDKVRSYDRLAAEIMGVRGPSRDYRDG